MLVVLFLVGGARDLWRPSIRADGVGYYAPLASLLVDGDLDLRNELGHLNPRYLQAAFMTPAGHLGDPFPVGPALLWLPTVLALRALPPNERLDAPLLEPPQTLHPAFAPRYARALWGANLLLVVLGGSVLVAVLARTCGWLGAAGVGVAGVFGTPVFFYTLADPSYGHAASFAVAAFFNEFLHGRLLLGKALGDSDSVILRPAQFVGNGPHAGSRTSPADDTRRWRTRPSLETAASWPRPLAWAS